MTLVLHWRDAAGVPRTTGDQAQAELVRLYERVGAHVVWSDPDRSGDRRSGDRRTIRVIVLPDETGNLRSANDPVMGAAITTLEGTQVVYAFYRRVEDEARLFDVSTSVVLACVIAHELGHLLLPARGHAPTGLMSGFWRRDDFVRADQGQLRFLPEEAALIRARLAARDLQAGAAPFPGARGAQ